MPTRLLGLEQSARDLVGNHRVVAGDLKGAAIAYQVGAAIANIRHDEPIARKQGGGYGGARAGAQSLGVNQFRQLAVRGTDGHLQPVCRFGQRRVDGEGPRFFRVDCCRADELQTPSATVRDAMSPPTCPPMPSATRNSPRSCSAT